MLHDAIKTIQNRVFVFFLKKKNKKKQKSRLKNKQEGCVS